MELLRRYAESVKQMKNGHAIPNTHYSAEESQPQAPHKPQGNARIEHVTSSTDVRWNAFVDSTTRASIYHHGVWKNLVADVFGHETHYLMAVDPDSELVFGVLPIVRIRSRLFGDYMVSMPYFNYGGAIATEPWIEDLLMREACKIADRIGVAHIEFRDSVPRDGPWIQRRDKVRMLLQLPDKTEILWNGLGSKIRAQIRRPEKEGVVTLVGGIELLDDFYRVFSRNMRDLGTPVYPRSFFLKILTAIPKTSCIVLVRLRGEPAAAGILIGSGSRIEVPWASSLRKFNSIGINMLLYWKMLETGIERGYEIFDFGRCTKNSGSYRFKKQWQTTQEQLYWHYWVREGAEAPNISPQNSKYRLAIKAWQHLPVFVANWIGPRIVKGLP